MKKPRTIRRHRSLALWLLALACMQTELFSQFDEHGFQYQVPAEWDNSFANPAPPPLPQDSENWIDSSYTSESTPSNGMWPAYSRSDISWEPSSNEFEQENNQPYEWNAPPQTFSYSPYSEPSYTQSESGYSEFVNTKSTPASATSQFSNSPATVRINPDPSMISQGATGEVDQNENRRLTLVKPHQTMTKDQALSGETEKGIAQPKLAEDINRKENFQEPPKSSGHASEAVDKNSQEDPDTEIAQNSVEEPPSAQESPKPPMIITPDSPVPNGSLAQATPSSTRSNEISINFNNVSMIEYIRFISRISNKNFIFDEENLQFNVTIVSEEPTTVDNLMAALLQELKIRDLSLLEQGNNIIIHRNPRVRAPARIVADGTRPESTRDSELVTRVFRLNTLDPIKASEIIRPLLSEDALVEVLRDTNNLIITDLVTTVNKIAQLIDTLDAPNSGVTIGQYVVRNAFVDSLVDLGTRILQPIAQGNPFILVPHSSSNSIFIVSNAFIVEKALAILQNLDFNEGRTKILSLEGLQPSYEGQATPPGRAPSGGRYQPPGGGYQPGQEFAPGTEFQLGPGGQGFLPGGQGPGERGFVPGGQEPGVTVGPGGQYPNAQAVPQSFPLGGIGAEGRPYAPPATQAELEAGGYRFAPGGIGVEGRPSAIFNESTPFMPGGIGAPTRWATDLPLGHIERTMFFIYKLRYRKGDQIEIALRKIANSLQMTGTANADLIAAINSSQWIESSNAMIFTGTPSALEKVRELILEVDVPLRQVFIEMLILDTSIDDSLSYGVDWITRFGGGSTTGEQGFLGVGEPGFIIDTNNPINPATEGLPIVGDGAAPNIPANFFNSLVTPQIAALGAYTGGVIGTHLTHCGTHFATIGALVRAIHSDTKSNILLNPKIITEDNNTAEIFVGGTDRYKTQSITNDLGSLVTNNFQFIDVGTTLRVTPLIGNNGLITLDIIQETTATAPNANSGAVGQDVNLVEVLTKSRSVTKIHVPNGFFVVLSGMIRDQEQRGYSRIPCLGGIPIIGAACKSQTNIDKKRNLMLFIRPLIVDSAAELEDITKRQQDVYNEKTKFRRSWNYEIDEGLNFLNLKPTDPDEIGCNE